MTPAYPMAERMCDALVDTWRLLRAAGLTNQQISVALRPIAKALVKE